MNKDMKKLLKVMGEIESLTHSFNEIEDNGAIKDSIHQAKIALNNARRYVEYAKQHGIQRDGTVEAFLNLSNLRKKERN